MSWGPQSPGNAGRIGWGPGSSAERVVCSEAMHGRVEGQRNVVRSGLHEHGQERGRSGWEES